LSFNPPFFVPGWDWLDGEIPLEIAPLAPPSPHEIAFKNFMDEMRRKLLCGLLNSKMTRNHDTQRCECRAFCENRQYMLCTDRVKASDENTKSFGKSYKER
jgi:hypothetical protein